MHKTPDEQSLKHCFCGKEYTLQTEEEQSYIYSLARYVEKRINDITSSNSGISALSAAVMVAFMAVDELHQTNRNIDNIRNELKEYIDEAERLQSERDRVLTEYKKALDDRQRALAERETAYEERDNAIAERDAAMAKRNSALSERNDAFRELGITKSKIAQLEGNMRLKHERYVC